MTSKEAYKEFERSGDLKAFILNSMEAYKEQLATTKTVSDTKYHHMKAAITGCRLIVKDCFEKFEDNSNG